MELKLNKLTNAEALKMLKHWKLGLEKTINSRPPADSDAARLEKFYRFLGNKSLDYGACLYQQQRERGEIRKHLKTAGNALLRTHELREKPEPNASRNPWLFLKAVNLSICFCGSEQRKLAGSVSEHAYRHPPRPDNEVIADYLDFLKGYLSSGKLDPDGIVKVEKAAADDAASKEVYLWILPAVRGLKSLASNDENLFNSAIDSLVKFHQQEALTGEFIRSPDGFICLPALMLSKLGAEKGLNCTVQSEYVPLSLLENEKRAIGSNSTLWTKADCRLHFPT